MTRPNSHLLLGVFVVGGRLRAASSPRPKAYGAGISNSGNGRPANSRRQGFASHRAQRAERPILALSVAMPVLAYICRYSFEMRTKASRARKDRTQRDRAHTRRRL
jgi:hypothetical protein